MPVNAQLMQTNIDAQLKARNLNGTKEVSLAQAVANAVSWHVTTRNMVSCSLNGLAGPIGNIQSIIATGFVPTAMSSLMRLKVKFTGRDWGNLCDAISTGICLTMQTLTLSGTAVGCATGAGTGRFTALDDSLLSTRMQQEMRSAVIKGRDMPDLCNAISFGVVMHLKQAPIITVTSMGAVSPTPPYGPISVVQIPSVTTQVS